MPEDSTESLSADPVEGQQVAVETAPQEEEEEKTFVCACCNESREGERHSTEDGDVCDSCQERYVPCDRCGHVVHSDNTSTVDDDTWCQNCTDNHSFVCDDCGDRFQNRNARNGPADEYLCETCYSENYFTCDSCDRVFHNDHYGEDGRCQDCCRDREDTGPIQDHCDYPPGRKFGKGPHWFGVELEVEAGNCDGSRGEAAQDCLDHFDSKFCIAKDDGSLDDGFELVTAPATLQEHYHKWNRFFDHVPRGLKSFETRTCGLHVHCSRAPLSDLQIAKIVCFVNAYQNGEFIKTIAGRGSGQYCQIKTKKIGSAAKRNPDRYEAVNLQNDDTIEFRIFKGTLKKESLFKAIEFCDALIQFTKPASRGLTQSMSRLAFLQFVAENRKLWPHLHAFIQVRWIGNSLPEQKTFGFKITTTPKDTKEQ